MPTIRSFSLFFSLIAFSCATCYGAPPNVPTGYNVVTGQLLRITAKGEDEIGSLRNFGEDEAFFEELSPKPKERRYVFQAAKPGKYVIGFWTKGELEGVACTVTVTSPTPPPVVPPTNPPGTTPPTTPPGTTPPVNPPTTPAGYYFLIIRPDGPADPKFTATMSLPEWGKLVEQKHEVRDYTVTDASKELDVTLPFGTQLPTVVTLVIDRTAGTSRVVRQPIPLPTTSQAILALPDVK